ncbi:DUF2946 family protein [Tautonia rosea]|uniref:DUF2946 family protein n=1 Tax=Tautonia rosea TaxID=2728037 RepID=UPI0014729CA6
MNQLRISHLLIFAILAAHGAMTVGGHGLHQHSVPECSDTHDHPAEPDNRSPSVPIHDEAACPVCQFVEQGQLSVPPVQATPPTLEGEGPDRPTVWLVLRLVISPSPARAPPVLV